jgi:hypothetical protein
MTSAFLGSVMPKDIYRQLESAAKSGRMPRRTAYDSLEHLGEGTRGYIAERLRDFGAGRSNRIYEIALEDA